MKTTLLAFLILFQGLFSCLGFAKSQQPVDFRSLTEEEFYVELENDLREGLARASKRIFKVKKKDEEKVYQIIMKKFQKLERKVQRQMKQIKYKGLSEVEEIGKVFSDWKEEVKASKERGTLLADIKNYYTSIKVDEVAVQITEQAKEERLYQDFRREINESGARAGRVLGHVLQAGLFGWLLVANPVAALIVVGSLAFLFVIFILILKSALNV